MESTGERNRAIAINVAEKSSQCRRSIKQMILDGYRQWPVQCRFNGQLPVLVLRHCIICGDPFFQRQNPRVKILCSHKCASRRGAQLRAHKMCGHPRIDRLAIFDRDEWKCCKCGKDVIRDKSNRHPDQANIDHIIPLSKGGGSETDNLQTLCRKCNATKAARVVPQLARAL